MSDSGRPAHGPLIELESVSMSYPATGGDGRVAVFQDMDLRLASGDFACVSGRSGSGKTTLLYLATGLLRPTTGRVCWAGRDLGSMSADAVARLRGASIGFVFQSGGLISTLTAAENVALPGVSVGLGRGAKERARELLALVGCGHRATHLPAQLSGGEVQRVALARSLFADPPVLVIDEPTANLDRATADGIVDLMVMLRSTGKALLVASHDRRVIESADMHVELD